MYKLLATILVLCTSTQAWAGFQNFSIDYEIERNGARIPESITIDMKRDRVRQDIKSPDGSTSFIFRGSPGNYTSYVLFHDTRTYTQYSIPTMSHASRSNRMQALPLIRSGDVCASFPGTHCRKIGEGELLGYKVTKWTLRGDGGASNTMWYAPDLGYFLKYDSGDLIVTAKRVDERTPPESRFSIPSGYTEQSLPDMMRGAYGSTGADPYRSEEPEAVDGELTEAAGEIGKAAKDSALEEIVEGTKGSVRDAIRGFFGK